MDAVLSLSFVPSVYNSYHNTCYTPSLFSVQPYEGGRSAISAYWADYTQAQLGAMMAMYLTVIEQSEAILAGPRRSNPPANLVILLSTRPQGLH